MAVMALLDASEFDVTKSYFNKLKSKEEPCFLTLENYRNEELNEMVKGVIVSEEVENVNQGVSYFKVLEYVDVPKELDDFLEELIDPTDIYTYVVKLGETYNDLRTMTHLVAKYGDNKLRFIGGNLLNLEGTGVGIFSESFISGHKLKTIPTVRFDFTQVKLIDKSKLVLRDIGEYNARKTQVKKSVAKKERTGTSTAKPKAKKKKSMMDVLSSY